MIEIQKKVIVVVLVLVTCGELGGAAWRNLVDHRPAFNTWTFMDAETGALFQFHATDLGPFPMTNPHTGKRTLYPTEVCLWGEDCRNSGGTRVIMNELLGKEGPTYCPVCGHLVRFHNPLPPDYHPPDHGGRR